jgi:serine/threonine-protein kinase
MYQRVGTQFGEFYIKSVLGVGGMAAVYLALHIPSQQLVALKVLSAQLSHIAAFRQRFELEAQITVKLDHPHIVPVINYGAVDETLYIAMRYLSGGTLHDKFVLDRQVSLQDTAHYLMGIAAGLDYAHAQGIIHRDLKLANVLLDNQKRALLSDFGIARLMESSLHLTESGSVLGSPHYMSPEQNEGKPLTAQSDLYSLAVMAFLMVTGQFPFHADTPVAIALQHVTKAPPFPSAMNPLLPGSLDAVILRGLAKSPMDRYRSGLDFAMDFTRALGEFNMQTQVNLPQLSRSRPTPARTQTPPTLPPSPSLTIASPRPEPPPFRPSIFETSAQVIRLRWWRWGALMGFSGMLVGAAVVVLFGILTVGVDRMAQRVLGIFISPTPIPTITTPPTMTPTVSITIPPTNTRSVTITVTSTRQRTAAPVPVTATLQPRVTQIPRSPSPSPQIPVTRISPYTAISKDIDPVNVRSLPSLTGRIIGKVYLSDTVTVFARTTSAELTEVWYLVQTGEGIVGWMKGEVVALLPIGSLPSEVPIALTIPAIPLTATPSP